jgi:hypothetical protein
MIKYELLKMYVRIGPSVEILINKILALRCLLEHISNKVVVLIIS